MQRVIVLILSILVAGKAQVGQPIILFPPQVKVYLGLSDAQVSAINAFNIQYQNSISDKAKREAQVQIEISQETAKPTLDPMAIGLRFLELEAIRRDLEAEKKKAFDGIQTILTVEQKTKAATLQNALSIYSTACAAVNANVITVPPHSILVYAPGDPIGSPTVTGYLSPTLISLNSGCGNSATAILAERIGDSPGEVRTP